MEAEIFNQKIIKGFLQNYPPKQWTKLIKLLIIHGIQELRASINTESLTTSAIQTLVINRQKTLITQKHLPDIKHQIQNLKKQLSYLDASVRLTQPPLDSSQIHSKSQAPLSNKLTTTKNYPQQTSASQITRLCNQFLPSKSINQQSGMFNISQRSRSPLGNNNTKNNQNTVKSIVSSSKHPQSTNNLDYSYSPTTLKSIIPENECINVHQVKPNYDNVITPNTSNLSNSVIRCHSDDTQLLHRRGRKSNLTSAFSTMVKAPSNWRKGDDSIFDRSQSKIKYTDRVSSTDCTLDKFSKSELESDKVMTLQQAYIERMKKSQAIQARIIQRHQRPLKKMKKSSSLSSMIYPKWWKQMDPVQKPNPNQNRFKNSRGNLHQTNEARNKQQSSYQSRIDRSAPVDFAPRNFNTGYQNTRDVSPPGTNTSFNISRISMNKSATNQEYQFNIDTLDRKFQEIHAKKLINGTASFQKYVQINPNNYEKVPDAPKTMPNKASIQFTIPTEINPSKGGVKFLQSSNAQPQKNERDEQKLSRTKNQQSQNFLTMREKKSNLAWNRCRQQPKKQQLKQNKDLKQKTRKKFSKKSENALSNIQSKIKRQLDFTRQVYRQTQKSNSTFIQIHCKQKQTPTSKSQYKNDNRQRFNQDKLTERDLQCHSQTQQFDEQVQKTIQKAQKNQYIQKNPQNQNAYYSMKPSISPLSSNQHSQSNSLSSTIINNKAGADRYIFYDKASQSPSPKELASITHQSNTNSSGQFMGYIPNHYQGQLFNLGSNNCNINNNNHNVKLGMRRDSNAPQNQTAQFHPTSPSNGEGMKIDGSIASAANNYYLSASSQHQSYPGSNRYTARSNVYHHHHHNHHHHGPQLSTNSGGMIDLQTMNMAPQNTSGPPTFQNRPASHKTKNSDPLQIVTGFLNNPVMMNMFSEKRKEDHFTSNNNEVIKTDQSPNRDYFKQQNQQNSQSSTPIRFESMNFNTHEFSNHQNFHHQTTNSESKYLHPRRDSTPLDFYKQIDGKSRPIQLESYENNIMMPRSSIGTSSNNTNKLMNDRGGIMYSSHASSSSGLPRYPTINQDTFDNTSYSKNQIHQNQTPPWNQASYLQSYSGTTNRSGTPASQIRGPSPVTTINPVTMNTNSSVGTGGVNTQYQSRFQVSVETNSKLNTDRNNNNNLGYNHVHQNQQPFNIDDYQSRFQIQSRGSSKDYTSGSAGGSYDNYRSRSNSQERNTVHSKHSSIYNNVEHNKQKMLNSGTTTLSNYQIPQSMKQFFCKQNPINIESNRTSQNQNNPSSRRQYFPEFLKNEGAGVYTNLRINNQVAPPLEDPPHKQKNNQFLGSGGGAYQNRKPSGVPIMDTVEQLQVSRAKLKSKQYKHQQEAENHQFVGKNINKENIGPDSQSKRAVFKSCTNISKRTIFGSMNCSDDQYQPPVKNEIAAMNPPTSSLVKALKQSETYVHKS